MVRDVIHGISPCTPNPDTVSGVSGGGTCPSPLPMSGQSSALLPTYTWLWGRKSLGPPRNPHCLRVGIYSKNQPHFIWISAAAQSPAQAPGPGLQHPHGPSYISARVACPTLSLIRWHQYPTRPWGPCVGSICAGVEVCRQDIPYIHPLHHAFSCAFSDRSVPCPSIIIAASPSPPLGSSVLSSSSPSHTYLIKDEKRSH